jgi:outer membrane receptor for ferrienterochelin and colicin
MVLLKKTLVLLPMFLWSISLFSQKDTTKALSSEDLMGLTLKELMGVKASSSSLTKVNHELSPIPVIMISQTDIELSGARNLDELLEIYVPGLIMMYKGAQGNALGVRGIISDRNNKVLLLLNGKIMNGRALTGAMSERFLTMLNDIDRIEVIQSPQSSLYGPGAISSVINIYTKTGKTKGPQNEIQVNQGMVDYFTNVQLRHSNKVNDDLSYSLYYGGDYATGASQESSKTKFTFNGTDGDGDTIISDQPITYPINNLNASFNNSFRHKTHAQIDYKGWSTWVRYTSGGMDFAPSQAAILSKDHTKIDTNTLKYKHLTAFTNYKNDWGKWGIDASLSYDQFSTRIQNRAQTNLNSLAKKNRENELYSRVIFTYEIDKFSIGAGPAVSFEKFGLAAYGATQNDWSYNKIIQGNNYDANQSDSVNAYTQSWSTVMMSGIGEGQYAIRKNINLLGGVRVDKHTYTGIMVSPRASIVWRPKENHLVRFQYSRSNRRQDDADLRQDYLRSGEDDGQVETIDFYELSGDIGIHKKVVIRPSLYYSEYDVVAWGGQISKYIGNVNYYGTELSVIYKGEKGYGKISHSTTKIIDFSKVDDPTNNVSSSAYGYGNSFHSFPDHLTKLFYQYKINKKMAISTSLQVTWYLHGAEDNSNYNSDTINNPNPNNPNWDLSDGKTTSYKPSAYLSAGYVYKFTDKLKGSLFAYNLLGLIDENLNKRVEFQRTSHYLIQPVAFALRLDYDF